MTIPIACIWYSEDQNEPSRPFLALVDTDDLIGGIAALLPKINYYQGLDQTVRVIGPRSIDLTSPKDPEDPDELGPTTRTLHLEAEKYYGDIAIHGLSHGEHFFLSFPKDCRDECLRSLGLLGQFAVVDTMDSKPDPSSSKDPSESPTPSSSGPRRRKSRTTGTTPKPRKSRPT